MKTITHYAISSITGPGEALTIDDAVASFREAGCVVEIRDNCAVAWACEADRDIDGSGGDRRVAVATPVYSQSNN